MAPSHVYQLHECQCECQCQWQWQRDHTITKERWHGSNTIRVHERKRTRGKTHPSGTTRRWIEPRVKRWKTKKDVRTTRCGMGETKARRRGTKHQRRRKRGIARANEWRRTNACCTNVSFRIRGANETHGVVSWVRQVQTHEPSHLLSSSNIMRTCPTRIPGCRPRVPLTCRKWHSTLRTPPHEPCDLRTVATTCETTYGSKRTCAWNVARLRHDASTRSNVQLTRRKKARHAREDVRVVAVESSRARFPRETQPTRNGVERDLQNGPSRPRTKHATKTHETIRAIIRRRNATSCVPRGVQGRQRSTAVVPTSKRIAMTSTCESFHHALLHIRVQVRRPSGLKRGRRSRWRSRACARTHVPQARRWDGRRRKTHPFPDHSTIVHRRVSGAVGSRTGEDGVHQPPHLLNEEDKHA